MVTLTSLPGNLVVVPEPPRAAPMMSLELVKVQSERALEALLQLPEESRLDARWAEVLEQVRSYALRPAKRLRPALLLAGHAFGRDPRVTASFWHFAAGVELLHTFLLVHDDVADQAPLRRKGPSLHLMLGGGKAGDDLAVVGGDHLFSRSLEAMLESGLPEAGRATRYQLGVCRETAVGQFLDLEVSRLPLGQVPLRRALKVARLKTAQYASVAPLVCGAMLGGADAQVVAQLTRLGRALGLAYQLQDDLLGLFGDPAVSGKPADSDLAQGKRTFPVLAAYLRAPAEARARLDALWSRGAASSCGAPELEASALEEARALVRAHGGEAATERAIDRLIWSARRSLAALPAGAGKAQLAQLIAKLVHRAA